MTHTLHREGEVGSSLDRDFVVLAMPSKDINHVGSGEKLKRFLNLSLEYAPVHIGDCRNGNEWYQGGRDVMLANVEDRAVVHAVFSDKGSLTSFLKALKQEDLGLSIVVSGIFETVGECCSKAGLKPHTENRSLHIWGKKELLPPEEILQITTMCGHAMIPAQLVQHMLERIKKGSISPEKAAIELAKPCMCGIFNIERAAELLQELSQT